MKLDDLTATPGVTRLDTTFTRDLPDRRTTLRVGDSVTGGGAFAFPVRFAGVQYGTNFGTDPAFVPFPLPTIGGLARQESAVDLLINDLERVKSNVPAGPFSISNLPVVTGSGEVQLRVTDLLGRQQVVTQPYYVSSRLLKPGLHDFSYEAGFERKHYGDESFDYGQALAAATERYGFSDHVTGEAHAEAAPDQQSVAAGGSYLLGRWGVVTTGAGVSQHHAEAGGMVEVGYEYEGRRFNFGARTRAQTSGFAQIGEDDGVTRTDQLNLGFDLGRAGSLGVLFLNREADRHDEVTTAVATYSHPLGPGLVSFRAAELVRPDSDLTVTAAYVLPLGTTRTVSTEVEERDGDVRGRVQYHQGRGASDLGLDYRLGADVGTGSDQSVDARLNYQTRVGTAEVDAQQVGGSTRVQGDVNGSVTLLDGHVGFSRQVGRAFGLVALPGYPNVRVYVDNREAGRTDQSGYLLVPGLRPYEANKVKLAVADLPIDAQLKGNEVTAVPFDSSGVRIGFDLDRAKAATAVLRDADGHPLPAGLALASADGGVKVTVAKNGFAQVDGIGAEPAKVEGAVGSRRFACEIPAPRVAELLPDLGEVTCR